jgi:hypothetical protein
MLFSDERTTELLGQQGQLSYVITRRPKGCPVRIAPLCHPDLAFLSTRFEGMDPTRFNYEEYKGAIRDLETGSVLAYLTEISVDSENGAVTLIYSITTEPKIVSDQLQVTFSSLYDTGRSVEQVGFEGKVASDIVEF